MEIRLRYVFGCVVLAAGWILPAWCNVSLAADDTSEATASALFGHFPDRAHAVVWRNWQAVEPSRIADVLGTSVENVSAMADSMGLPPAAAIPPQQKTRGYFWMTICRRNWHLLPVEQLSLLLDTTPEKLLHFLRVEEIANWYILGGSKPACPPVKYRPPDARTQQQAARIKAVVREYFGDELRGPGEPRFAFIDRFRQARPAPPDHKPENRSASSPRFLCSYLKIYGDPLMDPEVDMYPEGLLQRLADVGVNGVWLYGVLQDLAPGGADFPEFGKDRESRQANLRTLVRRAKRYGIDVYLYFNEPRAQSPEFFKNRPDMAGAPTPEGQFCLCTTNPTVRRWMGDASEHLFAHVPDLAGVFTISGCENRSNCAWARDVSKVKCPRCKHRTVADIYVEANTVIAEGVHRGNPNAKVLVWDWGWMNDVAADVIPHLPKSTWFMSVSEWGLPIDRGGVKLAVEEYSVSAVGPGQQAKARWALARQAGLKTAAKVQLNCSWELASLPYLPVLDLVAEHCHNLAAAGVEGMMLGWSLGGYPSPNLRVAQLMMQHPTPSADEALDLVARERFGPEGAAPARKAWTAFSNAYRQYPYHVQVLYEGPMQLGPANLLYPRPTGLRATMVGFPFDDLTHWRGPYPPEVFASQFEKVAAGWKEGLPALEEAVAKAPAERRAEADGELAFARAARLYFASAANQTRFILARDALATGRLTPAERQERRAILHRVVRDEIDVAREMFTLANRNSCIGFEAASQYFYLPLDLVEKVVSCRRILDPYPR